MKKRKEYDSIGVINVPVDKYWGASTQRSKKYFDIGKILIKPILIKSIGIIKKSAAIVHKNQKQLDSKIANAIIKASAIGPEPSIEANKISLIKPNILLINVQILTTALDL